VLFYGDKSNWWATYALWAFRLFGHTKVKILDGGRDKWIKEGRALTKEKVKYPATQYPVPAKRLDGEIRAFYEDALAQSQAKKPLVDVRSPGEYKGEVTHMPEYPQEGVLRGGHIPGAKSVPWKTAVNEDATFKSAADLQKIYKNLNTKLFFEQRETEISALFAAAAAVLALLSGLLSLLWFNRIL
jgi:thiosulfate/3-mercaptopyruvate sulfurtransferase